MYTIMCNNKFYKSVITSIAALSSFSTSIVNDGLSSGVKLQQLSNILYLCVEELISHNNNVIYISSVQRDGLSSTLPLFR